MTNAVEIEAAHAAKSALGTGGANRPAKCGSGPWQTGCVTPTRWRYPGRQRRGHGRRQRAHLRRNARPSGSDAGAHRCRHGAGHSGSGPACPGPGALCSGASSGPTAPAIRKTAVPMGVIAIIYEPPQCDQRRRPRHQERQTSAVLASRPLECWRSAHAIVGGALRRGPEGNELPEAVSSSRTPPMPRQRTDDGCWFCGPAHPARRGRLIRACRMPSAPRIQTGTGICHVFVDDSADQAQALDIIENAGRQLPQRLQRRGSLPLCGIPPLRGGVSPKLARRLGPARVARPAPGRTGRLDERAAAVIDGTAGLKDFDTEFRLHSGRQGRDSVVALIGHCSEHSTGYSEAILTRTRPMLPSQQNVDSAAVYVNCSTRFTDGGASSKPGL